MPSLVGSGCQEAVLTGVNITAYGRDQGASTARESARGIGLVRLLERILSDTEISRVRLSSLQPEDWNPSFHELWTTGRLCRHLHLSLQSGSVLGALWEEPLPSTRARSLGIDARGGRIWSSGISDNYVRVYAAGPASLQ